MKMKLTITYMKYVNQDSVVQKADLIIKMDMKHKKITREKENLKIWSQNYERGF